MGTAWEADFMTSAISKKDAETASLLDDPPKWDLVGPTVDDDIGRAIRRYGTEAVKLAVKKHTTAKKGRKPERDWPELREIIEADALNWLNGNDPFQTRTNYAIAQDFSRNHPGHSAVSTHQRIERKLKKKPYDRLWHMLISAENLSREGFPYGLHMRALEALAELSPENGGHQVWQSKLKRAKNDIADYHKKQGDCPAAHLSMKEVEDGAQKVLLRSLISIGRESAGLLERYLPQSSDKD
jgi:hypothetical protein